MLLEFNASANSAKSLGRFDVVAMKPQEKGLQEPLVLISLDMETFACKAGLVVGNAKF